MTLRQQVISGARWVALANFSKQLLNFIITIFLARLLEPEAFGLIGMITVFTGFVVRFSELGFTGALVQRKVVEERHLSSIFWVNITAGLLFSALVAACAPLIAAFYDEPALVSLTAVIGLNLFVGAFNDVQTALLQRSMRFRRLVLIEVISVSLAGAIAIVMAASGFGVWSLVAQMLADTLIGVIVMWVTTGWRPKLLFEWEAVRELLYFGSNLLGFQIFNYWTRNADNLLVGRYVDAKNLGFYARAYALMLLPVTQITRAFTPVLFPAFSRIQDDQARIKAIFLRTHRVIALISTPIVCGLLVTADSFVQVVYGEKWVAMIPILQLLCLVGLNQPTSTTMGVLYQSQGRTDLQFRWTLFSGIVTIVGFFIGVQWGVMGVVVSLLIREYLLLYPTIAIPGKLIGLTFVEYLSNLLSIYGITFLMGLLVWLIGTGMLADSTPVIRLIIQITAGIIIYVGGVLIIKPQAYLDLHSSIRIK